MASPAGTDQPSAGSRAPAAPATQASTPDWRRWTLRNYLIACLVALGVGSIMIAGWSLAVGGIGWDAATDTAAAPPGAGDPVVGFAHPGLQRGLPELGVLRGLHPAVRRSAPHGLHRLDAPPAARRLGDVPVSGRDHAGVVGLLRHGPCYRGRSRVPVRPRGGVRVVADACHAPVARDVAPGLQGRAGRRRPQPDHRRARASAS